MEAPFLHKKSYHAVYQKIDMKKLLSHIIPVYKIRTYNNKCLVALFDF